MLCKIFGFNGGDYEKCSLLGCYAVWLSVFLRGVPQLLITANFAGSLILSTLMMRVTRSSEVTKRHIQEDAILHLNKSHIRPTPLYALPAIRPHAT
jgi:hypothetical protein